MNRFEYAQKIPIEKFFYHSIFIMEAFLTAWHRIAVLSQLSGSADIIMFTPVHDEYG